MEKKEIQQHLEQRFETKFVELILKQGRIRKLEDQQVYLDKGQVASHIPIVLNGLLKVLRQGQAEKELFLYHIAAMQSCPMSFTCCMQNRSAEVKIIAEENSLILELPMQNLQSWMGSHESWKNYVMEEIQSRFGELLHALDEIAFHQMDQRLWNYLLDIQKHTGSALVKKSHEAIARDLGSSRVVISRLLKQLEQQEKVLLYRNEVKIRQQA